MLTMLTRPLNVILTTLIFFAERTPAPLICYYESDVFFSFSNFLNEQSTFPFFMHLDKQLLESGTNPPLKEMTETVSSFDNDGTPITKTASEMASTDAVDGTTYSYEPVHWHWFYLKEIDKTKRIWKPFSMLDSVALEDVHQLRN